MPRGQRRTPESYAKCALKGCPNRVKNDRQKYCSIAHFGVATRGVEKPPPPQRKFQGPFNQFTINPEKQAAHELSKPPVWLIHGPFGPGGFTEFCSRWSFSQDRKALYLYHASIDDARL